MGLLDDAIREHLELKRRSGADPGVIAQDEHEALDPIFPEEPSPDPDGGASPDSAAEDAPGGDGVEVVQPLETDEAVTDAAALPDGAPPPPEGDADSANVVQETAELDMRQVLDEDTDGEDPATGAASQPVRAVSARAQEQDDFEWQAPERSDDAPPQEIPGQERLSFE